MEPPPSSAVEPATSNSGNGRNGSTTKGRPMPPATAASAPAAQPNHEQQPQQGPDMAEAVIDLSSYDWLAFPHWAKVGWGWLMVVRGLGVCV